MNKYIIATFILLLAVQGYNTQSLLLWIGSIFGWVFNFLIYATSTVVNYSTSSIITVPSFLFSIIFNVNRDGANGLSAINATLNEVDNYMNNIALSISNDSLSATFVGQVIIGDLKDSIKNAGSGAIALSFAVVGCSPPQLPPLSSLDNPSPPPDFRLSNSTTNCSNTPIKYQASKIRELILYLIDEMSYATNLTQTISPATAGNDTNCTQSVADLWSSISAEANLYINVSGNGTLLAYANGSFSAQFSDALNQTGECLKILMNTTDTLAKKSIKQLGLRRSGYFHRRFHNRKRRSAYNRLITGFNNFRLNVETSLLAILNGTAEFSASVISKISLSSFIYASAKNQANGLYNLAAKMKLALDRFVIALNATIQNVEDSKRNVTNNVTTTVNEKASALINRILNENITECVNISVSASDIYANFSLNLESCGQTVDNSTQAAETSAYDLLRNLTNSIGTLVNATNNCYSTGCAYNLIFPFSIYGVQCANDGSFSMLCFVKFLASSCPTPKANNFNSCLNNALNSANSQANGLDSSVNSTLANFGAALSNVTETYKSCANIQVNATIVALASLSVSYDNCVAAAGNSTAP